MPSIKASLLRARSVLAKASDTAALDAEILLAFTLGKDRTWLMTWSDTELEQQQLTAFEQFVARRAEGEPVAYIVAEQEFWSLPLKVTPATLIPRPDTELLVETALQLATNTQPLKVLDLGTGSGAIALALASERPDWQIYACDQSTAALQVAEENAAHLNLSVTFVHSNWFDGFASQVFDLLISNPPYIEADDPHLLRGDVRFEPASALTAGADGLADIRHIAEQAPSFLRPGGLLMFEHGYRQAPGVRDILNRNGFVQVTSYKDLAGHERVTLGRKR